MRLKKLSKVMRLLPKEKPLSNNSSKIQESIEKSEHEAPKEEMVVMRKSRDGRVSFPYQNERKRLHKKKNIQIKGSSGIKNLIRVVSSREN